MAKAITTSSNCESWDILDNQLSLQDWQLSGFAVHEARQCCMHILFQLDFSPYSLIIKVDFIRNRREKGIYVDIFQYVS